MRERLRERVAPLMCMRRWRRIHMNIMIQQELLKHLPRRDEKIAVAPLTPELERAI